MALRWILGVMALLGLVLGSALLLSQRARRRLAAERSQLLDDVGLLSGALLPRPSQRVGDLMVSAAYRPAEGLGAGGDFYDVFEISDDRTALLIGDVCGHGREAVALAATTRLSIAAYLKAGLAPRETLALTSQALERQLAEGQFVTALAAIYDQRTRQLTYSSAGHPVPLVQSSQSTLPTLDGSPPLGIGWPTGLRQTTIPLDPGDQFALYTDGLTEALLDDGSRLGELGLHDLLVVAKSSPAPAADRVLQQIRQLSVGAEDDMALCLIQIDGPTPARAKATEIRPGWRRRIAPELRPALGLRAAPGVSPSRGLVEGETLRARLHDTTLVDAGLNDLESDTRAWQSEERIVHAPLEGKQRQRVENLAENLGMASEIVPKLMDALQRALENSETVLLTLTRRPEGLQAKLDDLPVELSGELKAALVPA